MKTQTVLTLIATLLFAVTVPAHAANTSDWIDELNDTVLFYQQHAPHADLQPYLDTLSDMRTAVSSHDDPALQSAEGRFITMLTGRDHGIQDTAADDLLQMLTSRTIETFDERPMGVPDTSFNTPYDGGPRCAMGGCDYWKDDVFDAGAG